MATRVRIECINKSDRYSAHDRITSIGGRNADGTRWRLPLSRAIEKIKDGTYSFYVQTPYGNPVNVVIGQSVYGHEYLKTVADGEQPNNLLALNECPV